jgi:transposase
MCDGLPSKSVAADLGLYEHTVGKWRRRFLKDRCGGLLDEARPGRPRTIDDDQVAAVIERTLRTAPADATELTRKRLRRGVHTSVRQLQADIRRLHRPAQPKPQALQMDQVRRSNIGFGEALLPEDTEDIMRRTLDSRD